MTGRLTWAVRAMSVAAMCCAGFGIGACGNAANSEGPVTASPVDKPVDKPRADKPRADKPLLGHSAVGTRSCRRVCFSLYTRELGSRMTMSAAIPGDAGTGGKIGSKITLQLAGDRRPGGDFVPSLIGQVFQFCGTDSHDFFAPNSYLCQHDAGFGVFEVQWAPFGNSSGLCAGVAVAGMDGENVTLRPCGVTDRTMWIADHTHGTGGDCRGLARFCPWISGSDSNYVKPLVLTLDSGTRVPRDQLKIERERLLPHSHGRAENSQEFAYFFG